MYELIKAGERTWYFDCPAKIGVIENGDGSIYLIDSGSDKDAGRKVRQVMEKNGWTLKGILVTHSNADHVGGNKYLLSQTGCRIFAPGIEACITRYPILEPSFLIGGYPCKELQNKFLMAQDSEAADITDPAFPQDVNVIPLPGHFYDMCGYVAPDGTVFLADCISSEQTLQKYGIPFIYDIRAYYETLDFVEKMSAPLFVPAHAEASENIAPLVAFNRIKLDESINMIVEYLTEKHTFEDTLKHVFDFYGLTLSMQQYALVGSTVRSILAYLLDDGKICYAVEENRILWFRQ